MKTLWVNPAVASRVSVVFPLARRRRHDETRGDVIDGVRVGTNVPPQEAFWTARGENRKDFLNAYVCHLYKGSPYDPAHNTHLANLCVFPQGVQSLSEWKPIMDVLHWHSFKTYGYTGPSGAQPKQPPYYPMRWLGVKNHSPEELEAIVARLEHLRKNRAMYTNPSTERPADIQGEVMRLLSTNHGGLTQKEVAGLIKRPGPQANLVLRRLMDLGKVVRREDPRMPGRFVYSLSKHP